MLDAIAAWELDAALEAPQRYLLRTAAIDAVANGRASVVVGARGAGKTAATRAVVADSSRERPAARIGMKDAFLAALRPLAAPEQQPLASAFARYLMLLTALEAMMAEKLLHGSAIRELAREFAVTLEPSLAEALPLAYSKALLYEVFGDRAAPAPTRGTVVERIPALEAAAATALKDARALVLFDEAVDRSVVAGALDALRVDALRTLLLGVADLARGPARERVVPVVFTRPGLFARLHRHEQEFWAGRRLDLTWTSRELKAAAGWRLARAVDPEAPPKAASHALARFLADAGKGAWGEDAGWDLVWSLSRARPRDMVFFLRAAARNCRHRGVDAVDAQALQQARKTYAAYLRQDMADEIRDAAPDVEELMDAIARHGKQRLSAPELVEVLERVLDSHGIEATAGSQDAIERFFEASAIGNFVREGRGGGHDVFVHDDPDARLDYTAPLVIHPGLASALDLAAEKAA
jgi:hypothetical protein